MSLAEPEAAVVEVVGPNDVVDRLAMLPIFAGVPRAELEWMAACGERRGFSAGSSIIERGAAVEEMLVLLAGQAAVYTTAAGGERRILDTRVGQVVGTLPYSRANLAPATVVAEDDTQTLALHRVRFPELVRDCPEVTAALVHYMIDRARQYYGAQLNEDRLQSLGRLASGLAHELNNPAAAATRHVQTVAAHLEAAERAARVIAGARLTDAQLAVVDAVRAACATPAPVRGALETADREDDIAEWLTRHHIDPVLAEAFASCDIDLAALDQLAAALPAESLAAVIPWVATSVAARELVRQIGTATGRIHDLVGAVKGFTFMDRESVPGEVDVARGLADTIAVLSHKALAKSVAVRLETAEDLPRMHGYGSEINQLWEKLIDNAIDAVGARGTVAITATSRGEVLVVRVTDDGSGISAANHPRVFDAFFTTKPIGQGTGLGLDFARRVVHAHRGDIDFTSQPGRTVFRVRLPVNGGRAGQGA